MKANPVTFKGGYRFQNFAGQPQNELIELGIPSSVVVPLEAGLDGARLRVHRDDLIDEEGLVAIHEGVEEMPHLGGFEGPANLALHELSLSRARAEHTVGTRTTPLVSADPEPRTGSEVGENPWEATTLEWACPSPPPHGNFATPPEVFRGPYEYSVPGHETDYWPQDEAA